MDSPGKAAKRQNNKATKQRREVIERAREEAGESIQIKTKGPTRIARGSVLSVRLNY